MKIKKIYFLFITKFFLFSLFFYFLYNLNIDTSPIEKLHAILLKNIFGGELVPLESYYHNSPTWALMVEKEKTIGYFIIDKECLGINIFFALLTITYSFPLYTLRKRIFLTFFYFFIVFLFLNPLRLIFLYYLFIHNLKTYLIFHNLIWQITNFLFVILLFFLPMKYNKSKRPLTN